MDWDDVVREAERYPNGSWFVVHESLVGVSPHKRGERRVILAASGAGPAGVVVPRSTKAGDDSARRPAHPAHTDVASHGRCRIDMPGWLLLELRRSVPYTYLVGENYSCFEPDNSVILRVTGQSEP